MAIAPLNALVKSPTQVVATPQATPVSAEIRGVWLTNVASPVLFVPWGVNRALHQLSQLNFNTVYPVVWNRGHTFYPSPVAQEYTGRPQDLVLDMLRVGEDVLAQIVKLGHQHNLRVIPWFEYGFMAPAKSELAKRHPDWISARRNSTKTIKKVPDAQDWLTYANSTVQSGFQKVRQFIRDLFVTNNVWLNPLHPEVQQFMLDLIVEVVTQYDVAGIQLDDHFGLPVEFGYDAFTVQLYKEEHKGKNPPDNPLDSEWMRWRSNKITAFMQRINQAVKNVKPNCKVSLSPNPFSVAYRVYLQDWPTWVQRGLVDELVLQVYRDGMSSFSSELSEQTVQMARHKIPVGVGIISGLWSHPVAIDQIQKQVKMVRDRGFNGVSFFYWESLWGYMAPESPRKRRAAFRKLFPSEEAKFNVLQKSLPQP